MVKVKSLTNASKGKAIVKTSKRVTRENIETRLECDFGTSDEATCMACEMTWSEDQTLMLGNKWVQCDVCSGWLHVDCLPHGCDFDESSDTFECHSCKI
ncbi:hypothetical protein DPMN_130385 [Dreissena polymorpha]|uniref:PHD-type domain-containing protein n=1 Tax=Dreissena polymorpha TaxID=45954 RepID=A0A9D4JZ51_DREPO|nr:hypothetical protein DPMN_130385 [Dreissena polymorpha]